MTGANFGELEVVGENGETEYPWTLVLVGEVLNGVQTSTVSVQPSDVKSWDHSEVVFRIPEGQGRNKVVLLTVADQVSTSSVELQVSYDPPVVTEIQGPAIVIRP